MQKTLSEYIENYFPDYVKKMDVFGEYKKALQYSFNVIENLNRDEAIESMADIILWMSAFKSAINIEDAELKEAISMRILNIVFERGGQIMCEHYIPPCMNNEEHEFIRHTEPICKTEEEYKRFMGIMCSPDIWGNDGGRAFGEYVDDNFLKTMMDDCTVDGETVVKTVRKFLSKCMETTHRVYNDDYDSDTAKSKVTKDFAYLTAWVAIMMRKAGISRYEFKEAVTDATHKIICGKR